MVLNSVCLKSVCSSFGGLRTWYTIRNLRHGNNVCNCMYVKCDAHAIIQNNHSWWRHASTHSRVTRHLQLCTPSAKADCMLVHMCYVFTATEEQFPECSQDLCQRTRWIARFVASVHIWPINDWDEHKTQACTCEQYAHARPYSPETPPSKDTFLRSQ